MTHRLRIGDLLALGLVSVVLVVLIGPIVLLTIFSFNDSTIISLPFEGFTLEWYRTALGDVAVQESLRNSVVVAADRGARRAWSSAPLPRGGSPASGSAGGASGRASSPLPWWSRGWSSA